MKVNQKLMGFAEGTKVLMADGTYREIEKIKSGDYVLSFDQLNAFGELEPKRVLNTFSRVDRNPLKVKVLNSDVELTVAPGQLFINPGHDWKDAININEIIDGEGNVHKFTVNQITRGKHKIYDIIVEDNHSLIANGVRVHNMLYTVGDVIAGRNLASYDIQSGALKYEGNDYPGYREYGSGNNRKKKKKKSRGNSNPPPPKVDGVQASIKYIKDIDDLVDTLDELVKNTSVTNLTVLKLTIQYSADTIVNFSQNLLSTLVNATMSAYDKSEALIIVADMVSTASALRKPFEETVVNASGKALAQAQILLLELLIKRLTDKLGVYTTPPEEKDEPTTVKKNRKTATRNSNGRYNLPQNMNSSQRSGNDRQSGGDFGSDKGRPTGTSTRSGQTSTKSTSSSRGGNTPSQATRSTSGTGKTGGSSGKDQSRVAPSAPANNNFGPRTSYRI